MSLGEHRSMIAIGPRAVPDALSRLQGWFASNTWTPKWWPAALRRPFVSYLSAVAGVLLAVELTYGLEQTLASYSFHGMIGFFAVLCAAIVWGRGPALLGATLNAALLNFVVEPPRLASLSSSPAHMLSHLVSFALSFLFGVAIASVAGQAEARRRRVVQQHNEQGVLMGEREHAFAAEQRAHEEAAAERDLVRQILAVLPEGVMIWDADQRVTAMNDAAVAIVGVNVVGKTGDEIDFRPRLADGTPVPLEHRLTERAMNAGDPSPGKQIIVHNPMTGKDVPVLASDAALKDARGAVIGAVSTMRDISEIKNLERQRDRMLATVAHDLRNPLTSISGMSQILQLRMGQVDEPVRERFAHSLKTIETAAQRMTEQISELLDYAQAQTGRPVALDVEPVDVVALLRQVVEEHQRSTERHIIELESAETALVTMIDPRRLERAIANLLVNAIKYSPQGGPIVVSVVRALGPDGQWLRIAVADQGLGIPSQDLPHIFEQYYRASNVAATIPGTGIGLANVRHMVERHGGAMSIESTEGVGTTVTLQLPLRRAEDAQVRLEG
jgi:signal transduction histidine kinase